jgi:ABC-type glutathione transport system ATPase component
LTVDYLEDVGPAPAEKAAPLEGDSDRPLVPLAVRDLRVEFPTDDGVVKAVDGVSFEVAPNEVLAIVGESGSGKTVMCLAVLGLLPKSARVSGEVLLDGENILGRSEDALQPVRGQQIGRAHV